uniref:Putative glycine-rich protein hc1 n=1 Tax=Triatoma dimidiata TaxID=72491 RepID=A0A0V0G737_TRIDM
MTEDLTDDQKQFVAQCETDFAYRYSEKDDEYTIVFQIGISRPPIIEPWRPKGSRNDRPPRDDRSYKRRLDDNSDSERHNRNSKRRY